MNKTQLQKELLEKVKEGIKPSDLKKKKTLIDEGYESDSQPSKTKWIESPLKNPSKTTIKQLKKEIKYWSQTAQTHLTNLQREQAENENLKEEIKKLKNNPTQLSQEVEQALKEANEKIRVLEEENKQLTENPVEFNKLTELEKKKLTDYNDLLTKYSKTDKNSLENYIETLKNKPLSPLTKEQQIKLKNYDKLVKERDSLKYFGKIVKSPSDALVDQVNEHIIKAYNSNQYLQGYYLSLMKRFLDWEFNGTEEQKEVCRKLKPNLNQCLSFLEKFQGLEVKPFQPLKG